MNMTKNDDDDDGDNESDGRYGEKGRVYFHHYNDNIQANTGKLAGSKVFIFRSKLIFF